ncbi:MAG TPA: winged helix DNA-binding protein [Acidimicrobiales bacterium]|nr:winged helix DNA-binding protein [Acidimicrobiales bacterium]
MTEWSFLTNHAQVLVCIAHDPGVRLRDIATTVGITERSAYAIVADLAAAGYVVKDSHTDGRRNCYQIQADLPLPEVIAGQRTIGEVLDLLVDAATRRSANERTALASQPERTRRKPTSGHSRSQLSQGRRQ